MSVIDRSKLFTALRIEADSERVVSILKRQQDEQATTATLVEIRRLKRDAEFRRAYIDHVLAGTDADDLGLPSDSEASS